MTADLPSSNFDDYPTTNAVLQAGCLGGLGYLTLALVTGGFYPIYGFLAAFMTLGIAGGLWIAFGRKPFFIRVVVAWLPLGIIFPGYENLDTAGRTVFYFLSLYWLTTLVTAFAAWSWTISGRRLDRLGTKHSSNDPTFTLAGLLAFFAFCAIVLWIGQMFWKFLGYDHDSPDWFGIPFVICFGFSHTTAGLFGVLSTRKSWRWILTMLALDFIVLVCLKPFVNDDIFDLLIETAPFALPQLFMFCGYCRLLRANGYVWLKADSAQSIV